MPQQQHDRKPGDGIINRYLPDATPEERERARRELKSFAAALFGVIERVGPEALDAAVSDSSSLSCNLCAQPETP